MKNTAFLFLILIMGFNAYSQNETNGNTKETNISIFKFYPNPATDKLYVLGSEKIKSIEFIDVFGKRASISNYNKAIIKIDISKLKKGIYVIRVINENDSIESKKLIIK